MSLAMKHYEYKVVPAPSQGRKAKGVKTTQDRFALAFSDILNEQAEDGWSYLRAETLPCDERRGLTGTQTTFQNLLVFRRPIPGAEEDQSAEAPETVVDDDLVRHEVANEDASPDDALRATRASETPVSRRLGPARGED